MATKNQQWIYTKRPEGEVTEEHYTLVESEMPSPNATEILVESKYISVDPYMRIQQSAKNTWENPHPLNKVQGAGVVAQVMKVGSPDLKDQWGNSLNVGDWVFCYIGWQKYGVPLASSVRKLKPEDYVDSGIPYKFALGAMGMPGITSYFGFTEIGKPKEGETLVVSGAAGAVGSIVVQLGKIYGCRVVAIAGSPDKVNFLTKELGADVGINYKDHPSAKEMKEALEKACPNGIDIYFDNVGGYTTDAVFELINVRARVIICGQISQYSGQLDQVDMGPRFLHRLIYTRATIQGVLARDHYSKYPQMLAAMGQWIKEKKVKYEITEQEGFQNLPKALNALFHGGNVGKMVVKV